MPEPIQEDVFLAVERFKNREEYKALRLHKLSGGLRKYHSFSANFSYRIIIEIKKGKVHFLDVGDHDIYISKN